MQEKDILKEINNIDDKTFMKIYQQLKNRAKKIEKKEKQVIIDNKFKKKGIICPDCKSFKCVKNGFKNDKQRYLCKNCKSSFDAFRNHFTYRSKLSYEQWDLLIKIAILGQSSRIIASFIKTSTLSAWFNRQKLMKSKQLAKTQKYFKKLSGIIEIDETFIKEIHKGNFKSKDDPRKLYIEPNAKNTKCCIQVAIDENLNIYAKVTNTKRLKRKWVEDNLTNKLIKENSLLKTDMHPLYDLVAVQTKCKLKQVKHNASKKWASIIK